MQIVLPHDPVNSIPSCNIQLSTIALSMHITSLGHYLLASVLTWLFLRITIEQFVTLNQPPTSV